MGVVSLSAAVGVEEEVGGTGVNYKNYRRDQILLDGRQDQSDKYFSMMLELSTTNSQFADFAVRDLVSLESHETFCRDPDRGIPRTVSFDTSFLENLFDNNIVVDIFCYVCIFDCSITHIFTIHG